ncbi:unnamed protein product [Paramecium primaurelia]|uniref:Uncharacterized protein n=2 Tax=Paramecium TaxID=5884 RepID=A0A8S1XE41_9CILI|nr:unnamed protein product [Paramecium primaurelia]CAD8199275.1 unnamed protein product [Paramecium pentaurelia]
MNLLHQKRSNSNQSLIKAQQRISRIQKQREACQYLVKQKSYSILQFQMENDGKISIKTNRRLIRSYSAIRQNEKKDVNNNLFSKNNSQLLYSPPKIPSPKHSLMLQKKTVLTKFPQNVRKSQQYLLNDILSNKPINQFVTKRTHVEKQNPQVISQKVSPSPSTYPLLFSEIQKDPMKYLHQAQQFSILYNQSYLRKLLKHDQRQ